MIRYAARSRSEREAAATGSKAIQLLSTENTFNSLTRVAEARAKRSALLRDNSFISTDAKCSSDSCERDLNTTQRAQGGTASGLGECNLLVRPVRGSEYHRSTLFPDPT